MSRDARSLGTTPRRSAVGTREAVCRAGRRALPAVTRLASASRACRRAESHSWPIHIDTDPGLDDLLALALALASPEVRLEGITTVAGNASIDAVTDNAQRFLRLAGVEIPIGRGASGPLSLPRVGAEHIHGKDGRRGIALPRPPDIAPRVAREVLRHSLGEGQVKQIVALGPLTNLARLIAEEPELLEGVEIVWMGGTLAAGNVTPVAEFNAFADPEAAARVLESGLPVRIIGLEVTGQLRLGPSDLAEPGLGNSPMATFLETVLRTLMEVDRTGRGGPPPCSTTRRPCSRPSFRTPFATRTDS